MSPAARLVAIGVAVLVVIGVAVVALNLANGPTAGPGASASQLESAGGTSSASPAASASPTSDAELLAALREIEEHVIAIRGLPAADIGPPDLITRAELAAELQRIFDEEYPAEDRERDTIALRALGLLEEGQDIAALQLQLLGDQVLGFYDDVDRRMVVVTDVGLDPQARLTYAHEYTHALQDAAFGLDTLETQTAGEDDRSLARTALIEGDASVAMMAWAVANLTPEELLQIAVGTEVPDMTGIPSWMVAQLEFPYTTGLEWVGSLTSNPLEPDFDAIDDAFADPPTSTEQIIHIEKWLDREEPIPVDEVDLASALGEGWQRVDATPIGEAMIDIILEYHGVPAQVARSAAAGWGGDRASIASGPDGAFAMAWRLTWDTPADAAEFADAYGRIVDGIGLPARLVELANGDTLVVQASDDGLLDRLQAAGS